jgi:hypothetical protein
MDEVSPVGHYSLLRWRRDIARSEARNVAVIVLDADGKHAVLQAAPISSISKKLYSQGILDAVVAGLEQRLSDTDRPASLLADLGKSLDRSLYLTPLMPTAVADLDSTAQVLYRALVKPRSSGSGEITSGKLLDDIVARLRKHGLAVRRGEYLSSFLFDAVIDGPRERAVLEVLSFATSAKDWTAAEHNAGHFLYAVDKLRMKSAAVIKPPNEKSAKAAHRAYDHVCGWMKDENIRVLAPEDAPETLAGVTPLY